MRERVKFYGKGDLVLGTYSKRIENVVELFQLELNQEYCINDILEFYSINKFVNSEMKSNLCNEKYNLFSKKSKEVIGKFFSNLQDYNIASCYKKVDKNYRKEFWECFGSFKLYTKVTEQTFTLFLGLKDVMLEDILHEKKIVEFFGKNIKEYFITNPKCALVLLDKYVLSYFAYKPNIYLPSQLTLEDKETIINCYIDSDDLHINYLEAIINVKNQGEFKISSKTKLKAKNSLKLEQDKIFKNNTGIKYGTSVEFSREQDEEKIVKMEGYEVKISFSTKWIKENNDYATLLNNFIYLFEYTDIQMRINFVSKEYELGLFEKSIFIKSITDYPIGIAFQQKNMMALVEMMSYYKELLRQGIKLENIIEWFFKEYMGEEFGVEGFNIELSKSDFYLDKCRSIFPELEAILKQYKMYVEDGAVNGELLQISSDPLNYDEVPSLISNKYVYGKGKDYNIAKDYLTSDQCMLSYIERIEGSYNNFFDLLNNEQIYREDYDDFYETDISWLCEHKFICVEDSGEIKWKNYEEALVIADLAKNDVISYWHMPQKIQNAVKRLENVGIVEFKSSLFSIPEQNYISFILNQNKYGNGYEIRNKYAHGSQSNAHEQCYMYGLMIFIIAIIKINDELCIRDTVKTEE